MTFYLAPNTDAAPLGVESLGGEANFRLLLVRQLKSIWQAEGNDPIGNGHVPWRITVGDVRKHYLRGVIAVVVALSVGAAFAESPQKEPLWETPAMPANPPATWLTYHLAHPAEDVVTGDPNAPFYWKGRYHLFYIVGTADSDGGVRSVSWAHVSSEDMVRWRWHPTTLTPESMGHSMFSGTGFLTKEGRPAIIYHGEGTGRNWISFAEDDLLETWSKPVAVEPKTESGEIPTMRHWDPDCWLDGETYYAVSGGSDPHLMKSSDLKHWRYLGRLLHDELPDVGIPRGEDISCPNMFKIGEQWMLLNLSHWLGARYYLGHFKDEKYVPEFHGLMNWFCEFSQGHEDADVFAPESLLTPDGRRVMWAWSRVRQRLKDVPIQGSIQCLPRELSMSADGVLRIQPLRELEHLRYRARSAGEVTIPADAVHRLEQITGDALELRIVFQPGSARKFGIQVYCDPDGINGFPIAFEPESQTLTMGETNIPFALQSAKDLELRVFLDKCIIEVFANDRLAALAPHRYAPGDLGVSVFSEGDCVRVRAVNSWKLRSIYAGDNTFTPADASGRR